MQLHAKSLTGASIGKVRIGTLSDPQFFRVGEFINLATARYPMLEVSLHQGVPREVLQLVRHRALHAAFYSGALPFPAVAALPVLALAKGLQGRDCFTVVNTTPVAPSA